MKKFSDKLKEIERAIRGENGDFGNSSGSHSEYANYSDGDYIYPVASTKNPNQPRTSRPPVVYSNGSSTA